MPKIEVKEQLQESVKLRDTTARTIINRSKVKELTMRPVYTPEFKKLIEELENER